MDYRELPKNRLAPQDGSDLEDLITVVTPVGIALDPRDDRMYWTQPAAGNLNGWPAEATMGNRRSTGVGRRTRSESERPLESVADLHPV